MVVWSPHHDFSLGSIFMVLLAGVLKTDCCWTVLWYNADGATAKLCALRAIGTHRESPSCENGPRVLLSRYPLKRAAPPSACFLRGCCFRRPSTRNRLPIQ